MKRRAVISNSERGYSCSMEVGEGELVQTSVDLPVQIHPGAKKTSSTDLAELVTEIQKADSFIRVAACSKLQSILTQVRHLQEEAVNVLREASANAKLHHAACNFKKVPGKTYHLYQRQTGQTYFSMLSPEEWGLSVKDEFLGSYRLELDMSWTPVDKIFDRQNEMALINKILNAHSVPRFNTFPKEEHMMVEN